MGPASSEQDSVRTFASKSVVREVEAELTKERRYERDRALKSPQGSARQRDLNLGTNTPDSRQLA